MLRAIRVAYGVLLMLPGVLAAQDSPSLQRMSFLTGCWSGPYSIRGQSGTREDHWTAPAANGLLGTSRYLAGDRMTSFEFVRIGPDSAGGLALVPYPDGVRAARDFRLTSIADDSALFEAPDNPFPKRIRYRRDAQGLNVTVDNGPGDSTRFDWLMRPVACPAPTGLAAGPGGTMGPDRSGTSLLYTTQALNGLWLGIAVPAAFGANDPEELGVGLLLGAPAGLLFAKAVNDARPVSVGQAVTITWGGWWGLANSLFLFGMRNNQVSDEDAFRYTSVGLITGTTAGLLIARKPIAAGDASLAAHASFWGAIYGLMGAAIWNPSSDKDGFIFVMAAGNAALLGGVAATKHVNWSSGRVWVITAAGITGFMAGLGVDLIAQAEDDEALAIPMIASFAGLATGVIATSRYDRQRAAGGDLHPNPALVGLSGGHLRLGVPSPAPALVPRDDGRTRRYVPGMRMTLFEWRH